MLILAIILPALASAQWTSPSPVLYSSVKQLVAAPGGAGTYAWVPHVVVNGTVITPGAQNLQDSFDACAASCSQRGGACNGFMYCSQGPCYFTQGRVSPQRACQLMDVPTLASAGVGPLSLATGNTSLGDAGIKILVDPPNNGTYPGYTLLFAQALPLTYLIRCNESLLGYGCVLSVTLQEALDRCSNWSACQALVVGPGGITANNNSFSQFLVAFGGRNTSEPLDPTDTRLNPGTYTLVRDNWQAQQQQPPQQQEQQESSSGGGLSGGIAIGAAVAAAVVALGAWVLLRRRQLRRRMASPKPSPAASAVAPPAGPGDSGTDVISRSGGGLEGSPQVEKLLQVQPGASKEEELAAVWGKLKGGEEASEVAQVVASMFSEAQLAEVIIPSKSITLAYREGRPYKLGKGASGEVYLARLNGVTNVAVKMFDLDRSLNEPKYFIEEAVTLRRLIHPHLIQFLGVSITTNRDGMGTGERGLIVMELAAGDLWSAIQADGRKGERSYSWSKKGRKVALQIASALLYLHQHNILHMDLKPQNVLIMRDGNYKLADVGFSRVLSLSKSFVNCMGRFGTFNFCAPEVLVGGNASKMADIYSFGVVLWQLCTGRFHGWAARNTLGGSLQAVGSQRQHPAEGWPCPGVLGCQPPWRRAAKSSARGGSRAVDQAKPFSFVADLSLVITSAWLLVGAGLDPQRGNMERLTLEQCPQAVIDLQARCCAYDPSARPSAEELVGVLSSLTLSRGGSSADTAAAVAAAKSAVRGPALALELARVAAVAAGDAGTSGGSISPASGASGVAAGVSGESAPSVIPPQPARGDTSTGRGGGGGGAGEGVAATYGRPSPLRPVRVQPAEVIESPFAALSH
ncbi:hypothetical protein N2152v2_005394 [Parachlorella kessleri]